MKNTVKKITSILLCATMAVSLSACSSEKEQETEPSSQDNAQAVTQASYNTAAKAYTKNETVFVNMDPEGAVTSKIVTDWLHRHSTNLYRRHHKPRQCAKCQK